MQSRPSCSILCGKASFTFSKIIMKKFFFSIIFIAFYCVSFAFSVGGNVFHGKTLSVIKTEYFDIIFSDDTYADAKKIAFVADSYYREIAGKFGAAPSLRFPVTITREEESLNGFYSPFPYNMIVLYVAEPDLVEMESYSDTLLSVFYHELTHAVTLNMKSPLFQNLSKVFGDFMTPAALNMPYFWIEGAAVFSESEKNEDDNAKSGGRLKNPYFTSLVVQAKINDVAGVKKFPSWRDVLGARDTTPGGSDRYVFGGCFAEYLVQNYGMEKYAELWKNAGESASFSFSAGVFEKTYRKKIDEVWKKFKDSINIQQSIHKDEDAVINQYFTNNDSLLVSNKNAFVSAMDVFYDKGPKKIAFYDSASHAVFFCDFEKDRKPEKLFSATGITNLRFSDDGEKIFVTRYSLKKTVRIENGIFNIKKKRNEILEKDFDDFDRHVSIEKNGLNWEILFNQKKYYPKVQKNEKIMLVNPHFLKHDEKSAFVSFSWALFASKNDDFQTLSLPKCGILKINLENGEGSFYLQKNETFAHESIHAVNDAALLSADGNGARILAVLEDYEQNPLYEITLPPLEDENGWKKVEAENETLEYDNQSRAGGSDHSGENLTGDFKIEKFSSLPYLLKGTKLPIGTVPLKNEDFEISSTALLGATYITSKTYLDDIFVLSAGYDFFYDDGGLLVSYSTSDESSSFSSSSSVLFDSDIFKQASENLTLSKTLWRGLVSLLNVQFTGDLIYGRTAEEDVEIVEKDGGQITHGGKVWKEGFFTKEYLFLTFSNAHKVAPKPKQIFGFTFQPFLDFEYKNYKTKLKFDDDDEIYFSGEKTAERYLNAGAALVSRVPGIFPLTLTALLFPTSSYFVYGSANVNLLEIEIQKGIPAVSVYAARFDLNLSYFGRVSYNHGDFWDISKTYDIAGNVTKDDYSDQISLTGLFTLSPNIGYAADSSVQFKIGASVFYRPNQKDGQSKSGFGITGKLGS